MEINISQLHQTIFEGVHQRRGEEFINHIKQHLKDGEDVICKCCGKSVEQVQNQRIRDLMTFIIGAEETEKALKGTSSEDNGELSDK